MTGVIKLNRNTSINQLLRCYASLLIICIPIEPILPYSLRWAMIIVGALVIFVYSKKIYLSSYIYFQICFFSLMAVSLLYSPKGADPMGIIIQYSRSLIQSFVIVQIMQNLKKDTKSFFEFIFNNFTIGTIVILIYTIIIEREQVFFSNGYWRLGTSVFAEHGTFMILSYCVIISVIWSLYNFIDKRSGKNFYLITSAILLVGGALTGTKKVFIAIGIFIIAYVVIKYRKNGVKMVLGLIAIGVLLATTYYIMINNEFLYPRIGYRIENFILSLQGESAGSESTVSRALMRSYGLEMFKQSPIYGNGVSSFRWYYKNYAGEFLYSHCNYVELLCNHGIIGFAIYYGYHFWIFIKSFKSYLYKKESLYLFMSIYMLIMFVLDYGQVSYYRVHFMLMIQTFAMTLLFY